MAVARALQAGWVLGLWLLAGHACAALTGAVEPAFVTEPPAIQALLVQASTDEQNTRLGDGEWQAARLYCQASRLGSAEAQYRLGMLYAFGKGVPKSRALGASLFSLAAAQGHLEAQRMLDTIAYSTTELPPCVLAEVDPEQGKASSMAGDIDLHIRNLPASKRWVVDLVGTLAEWYQVDPRLVLSVIAVESNFKTGAQSPKAAMGLMQLIPATAERFNVRNAYDATQNLRGGITYLRWLLAYFQGDVKLAVAGYNAGERAVDRYKGVPPYAETQQYVRKVMALYPSMQHPFQSSITEPSPLMQQRPPHQQKHRLERRPADAGN